jgi:hypothetical protein
MPAVEQIVDAVPRRIVVVVRHDLDDLTSIRSRLAPAVARAAPVTVRAVSCTAIGGCEHLVAEALRHHRLDEAGAVADDQEMNLPARTARVQPPFEGDLFAFVLADVFDVDVHSHVHMQPRRRENTKAISLDFFFVSWCFRGCISICE